MEVGALTKIYSEIYSRIWGEICSKSLLKILRVKNSNQNFRNLGLKFQILKRKFKKIVLIFQTKISNFSAKFLGLSFQILGLKFESLDQNLELVSNLSLKKGGF